MGTESAGIIPRTLTDVLQSLSAKKVFVSFIEIYNEKAFDLLHEDPTKQINVKGVLPIVRNSDAFRRK